VDKNDRILRCHCTNEKTLVDCDLTLQQEFDQKEACRKCYPELYPPYGTVRIGSQ
jgi:hypothetical protein